MRAVFIRILLFVIGIDVFYMSIGQFYLTQAEDHPPPELEITVETDVDTLIGMGETLVAGKGGCLLCHKLTDQGNSRAPDLRGVGGRADSRRPGMSAEDYLLESLVDPGAYVVVEFATAGGESIMPAADLPPADMSPTEIKALMAFLQSLGGEITVEITAEDVAGAARKREKPPEPTSSHPGFALLTSQGCVACHDVTAETKRIGPPLTMVGERLTAAEIRQSIVDPNAVIAEGFQPGLMLANFADTLSDEQLDQLVAYLSGEVSFAARLAHPGVQLLGLIVLFNAGIMWGVRRVNALGPEALEPGQNGGAAFLGPMALGRWGGLAAVIPIAAALFLWDLTLAPERRAATSAAEAALTAQTEAPAAIAALDENAHPGEALFKVTCPTCHGADAKGVPGLGKDMTNSEFIRSQSDAEMVEFIKRGRPADDPANTTGVAMPPKGANVVLSDEDIMLIVQYMRTLSN